MVYIANDPKVVFETIKQTNQGIFFPGAPAKIRFWSTTLPGSDPNRSIVIADTGNVGWHPYISGGSSSDVFASLCRPVIGKSISDDLLCVSFMVPTDYVGGITDTCSYNSVWLTYSASGGSNWVTPVKITPDQPLRDWTYPSISPVNYVTSYQYFHVNMTMLFDSIPGTYINHQGNGESLARQMFVNVEYTGGGIQPIAPYLINPSNGSTGVSLNPALDWSSTCVCGILPCSGIPYIIVFNDCLRFELYYGFRDKCSSRQITFIHSILLEGKRDKFKRYGYKSVV